MTVNIPNPGPTGKASLVRRWLAAFATGEAGNYLSHADKLASGSLVFLVCRVSHCTQHRRRNLASQERELRHAAEERGWIVVKVVRRVKSGFFPSEWLPQIARDAKESGAVLVFATVSRAVRNIDYRSNDAVLRSQQPTQEELESLRSATYGVGLYTLLTPTATASEEHGYLTALGMHGKGHLGGRPAKAGHKAARWLPEILRLLEEGWPVRAVARRLGLPESNVRRWAK